MTVAQLIEALKEYPGDAEVLEFNVGGAKFTADGIEFDPVVNEVWLTNESC